MDKGGGGTGAGGELTHRQRLLPLRGSRIIAKRCRSGWGEKSLKWLVQVPTIRNARVAQCVVLASNAPGRNPKDAERE